MQLAITYLSANKCGMRWYISRHSEDTHAQEGAEARRKCVVGKKRKKEEVKKKTVKQDPSNMMAVVIKNVRCYFIPSSSHQKSHHRLK